MNLISTHQFSQPNPQPTPTPNISSRLQVALWASPTSQVVCQATKSTNKHQKIPKVEVEDQPSIHLNSIGHHCNVSLRCLQNHIPLQKRGILQIPFMMEIRKMQSSSVKKNYFAIPRFYISDALLQIDLLSICVFVRRAAV